MTRRTLKEWAIRLALLLLGLTIAHFGVTLFLQSSLGSDPFSVLVQGISVQAGLSFGTIHIIVTCSLMALMLIGARGYVLPGTVVCAFCGGPIIDAFTCKGADSRRASPARARGRLRAWLRDPCRRNVSGDSLRRRHRPERPGGRHFDRQAQAL